MSNCKPDDTREPKFGWAPGSYMRNCLECEERFMGDKRAVRCADCAYSDEAKADWEKLPRVEGHIVCGTCKAGPKNDLDLESIIATGFGSAGFSCDGEQLWDENNGFTPGFDLMELKEGEVPQALDVEKLALKDPDHDWRVFFFGPMYEAEYQRQGAGEWILISKGDGFA